MLSARPILMDQRAQVGILVLGGTGMLGHKMFQRLRGRFPNTYCTIRGSLQEASIGHVDLLHQGHVFEHCDAANHTAVEAILLEHKPAVIVNCVGIVKQRPEAKEAIPSLRVNALLPHRLAEICRNWGGRLIHISTDCVFSGRRGNYTEDDVADAEDLYGRTKSLGEVTTGNALTLRTSIIGRELVHQESLLEWLLQQDHRSVFGFRHAWFSGVTTAKLADVVGDMIEKCPSLDGLYQVTSEKISKYELLGLLRDAYGLDMEIAPDDTFFCDRSMCGAKFQAATGYVCPAWPALVAQLVEDETPYDEWRTVKHEVL
jgi:dTDP-4-dehydrorhamnose reductase